MRLGREVIAMRIAKELRDGEVVNLGIGLPTLVANFLPLDRTIILHSENGVYGFGHVLMEGEEQLVDYHLTNAGGQFVSRAPGMCLTDYADAFDAVHIGRVATSVLGAYQVSEKGDLANWTREPEGYWGSIGGAMDMVMAKRVIVGMEHTTHEGKPRIVRKCSLALTATECVDLIVTDLAVIEVTEEGLLLKEIAPKWTVEEVQMLTEPKLTVDKGLKEMEL
jgi:acetate CoA/acetoacetate CoA-transferase beta subunit